MRSIIALAAALFVAPLLTTPRALAQEAYLVRPGDVLRIEVIEDPSLNRQVLVPPDGRIAMPLAGSVQAGGRAVDQVQADLIGRLAPNFAAAPSVTVSIDRLAEPRATAPAAPATVDIYVLGQVAQSGRVAVAPGTTLLQLFAEMGGFSPFAATKRIQLRRTDRSGVEKVFVINYDAIEQGTSQNGATVLQDGDVIVVPQRRLFE
jgi:polysaccharide export outer membrane protein